MPPPSGTAACKSCTAVRNVVLHCAIFRKNDLRAFIINRRHQYPPTHLGIFAFGWKTDVAPVAHRMVARSEIVHVQVTLVQKHATTAHFRMGIGNVLASISRIHELGDPMETI